MMAVVEIETNDLITLLSQSQRRATIAGNTGPQVYGIKLMPKNGMLHTTWIVKDGISSLSNLCVPMANSNWEENPIYLPDIDRVLGILKFHGGTMKITSTDDKVVFKSNNKQTTIQASGKALAFPNGRDSLISWAEKSEELASRISKDGFYETKDGNLLAPMLSLEVDGIDMFEAFRCAGINNQDPDVFVFDYLTSYKSEEALCIRVGQDLKGATKSKIDCKVLTHSDDLTGESFEVAYNGGFDSLFKHINGPVKLSFFDFREANQGMALLISWGSNWVLQASFEQGR